MNTMDNAKVISTLESLAIAHYLQNLLASPLRRITLFSSFPYSGSANLSDPKSFILVDNLKKIVELNSGRFDN